MLVVLLFSLFSVLHNMFARRVQAASEQFSSGAAQ